MRHLHTWINEQNARRKKKKILTTRQANSWVLAFTGTVYPFTRHSILAYLTSGMYWWIHISLQVIIWLKNASLPSVNLAICLWQTSKWINFRFSVKKRKFYSVMSGEPWRSCCTFFLCSLTLVLVHWTVNPALENFHSLICFMNKDFDDFVFPNGGVQLLLWHREHEWQSDWKDVMASSPYPWRSLPSRIRTCLVLPTNKTQKTKFH